MGVQVIPIPIEVVSHSHSQFRVLFPFPQDSHGIPIPIGNLIPMHISSQEHIKAAKSPKWCKIGPRLLLRTNRKSHTRFRLVLTSMTLDDLEGLKRHSCKNEIVLRSPP